MTIRPSEELKSVVTRWVDAMNERDFATAANLFLRTDAFRYVGSDAHEWWSGPNPIDSYERRQSEMPGYVIHVEELEAYEMDSVGWAALLTTTTFEGLSERCLRWTFVFVLDSGIWRIVQIHDSFTVPNVEVMGVEMTKSLEDLLGPLGGRLEDAVRATVRQGTVTLLFTDIEGSSELAQEVGDADWATVVRWHDDTIRAIVERAGGSVVKTLGDGAMIAFESVRDAARAAGEIQRAIAQRSESPGLRLRMGIHTGDAVSAEGDYIGTAVNKAARVAASASGGQIMASSAARALLEDDAQFAFGERRVVELKGIGGLHEISELVSVPAR
ncbi:MAG TPA: adenylate/guanylate cyclase domain-containing protein [Acidimicrobiia bacterium]|nr:adenylate/guanylate cyclase domain-containing protein [Acidimicrobiia bacterium]